MARSTEGILVAVSRVKELALPQRVVLVVGIGLCLLSAWSWWYLGSYAEDVQTAADFLRSSTGTAGTDPPPVDTYYVETSGGWQYLAVPVGLVVLWTSLSLWLLGPASEADQRGR